MRRNKYLLAIDFDMTLTTGDHIRKSWGNRLSKKLRRLLEKYPIDLFILSAANMSHIFHTTVLSGSAQLLLTMLDMPLITHETQNIDNINHNWGETRKKRRDMINKITGTENYQDTNFIIASKKTNYLIRKSREEDIPHSHVFFLDDNNSNIRFAKYHGFQAFLVDNNDKDLDIFKRLHLVEKTIRKKINLQRTI